MNRLLQDERVDPSDQENRVIIDAINENIQHNIQNLPIIIRLLQDPRVREKLKNHTDCPEVLREIL